MKIFCLLLLFCLSGCADRYSLDKGRGPDPQGIVANNPLVLPPDYLLRAPEPAAPVQNQKTPEESKNISETPAAASVSETPADSPVSEPAEE